MAALALLLAAPPAAAQTTIRKSEPSVTQTPRQEMKQDTERTAPPPSPPAEDRDLPRIHYGHEGLPPPVARMREALLVAAFTGEIDRLGPVLAMNELMPMVGEKGVTDPIVYWKAISVDGTGRDVMAEIIRVLRSGYVLTETATGAEMYVWPYHAAYPIDRLTPRQRVELYLLASPEAGAEMQQAEIYTGYRIGIGPDGTLHYILE